MRILHISDTHGQHRSLGPLPGADVVVHSGDICMAGTEDEVLDFMEWFCDLPYAHKVFIGGNHDRYLEDAVIEGLDANCHYLCNSAVVIDGVKFYGVPLFMHGSQSRQLMAPFYQRIPADTDVLITHAPPYGVLDFADGIYYGSDELLLKVGEVMPRLHLFGHIHDCRGIRNLYGTLFSNGSVLDNTYTLLTPPTAVFDI